MQDFYEEKAISWAIGETRPYRRYERGDPTQLLREHWATNRRFATFISNQTGGIIIPRYPPVGFGLLNVPAEIKPDEPVLTRPPHPHYHGDDRAERGDLIIPWTGRKLPKRWIHRPENMRKHIEDVHGGVNTTDVHLTENRPKYVFPPGDGAKRLDMHPHAWTRFRNERVFFGIEGCIKADAMLSAGEAVFSVPSVTLWMTPELRAFARKYLVGRTVYIVPDADAFSADKPQVMTQALFCRTYLRKLGVYAHMAAPPYGAYLDNEELKGIDDHLAHGGTMSQLEVFDRETHYGLAEWLAERRTWRRKDRLARNAWFLEGLATHADRNGQVWGSLRFLSRALDCHHSKIRRAVEDLEDLGAIHVQGSLDTKPQYRHPKRGWVGWDWEEDPPVITITSELRAKDTTRPLGD